MIGTAALGADSAQSQLTMSVTVARSCIVDAQPAIGGAPRLRLDCASGAARDVQVSESTKPSAPVPSGARQDDLRLVTVNF
jgi:hypothetical protein